jgi:hypothetical protein
VLSFNRNFKRTLVWRSRTACRQYSRRNHRVAGLLSPPYGHTVDNQRDDDKRDRVQELRCLLLYKINLLPPSFVGTLYLFPGKFVNFNLRSRWSGHWWRRKTFWSGRLIHRFAHLGVTTRKRKCVEQNLLLH